MATNGESARQWLKDNHTTVSVERIQQIIASINQKIEALSDEHPEYEGLLEALDAMEEYLLANNEPEVTPTEKVDDLLDSSPLIPEGDPEENISPEEKARRFRELLKKSDL